MNTIHLRPPLRSLTSFVLVLGFALTTPSLYAQTFAGRGYLVESPVSLRAFIHPDTGRTAIIMRLDGYPSGSVRIHITNEKQETFYNGYVSKPKYAGRFDLSALPFGVYTIELSDRHARYTQQFRIEPKWTDRVVMVTDPPRRDSLLASY
ncbi:hypothetical protein DYU11_05360 [Fibrisoma montanum]|uniref:Uncharacterized protein n=1 Tax=Fibrisoma montanum TaxID=2305895 RepID=A0A418MK00_9BACT|nr:hypothetical protein [Fibrisoma montanum]RIV27729.1 hypothetical protein DYU11_05360 [Fibrisoma montanum]